MTDEQIDLQFPARNSSGTLLDTNLGRREGAKWHRDNDTLRKEVEELRDELFDIKQKIEYEKTVIPFERYHKLWHKIDNSIQKLTKILSK